MPKKLPPVLKSVAIHQLRSLAVELKKTPTRRDIIAAAKQKKCPSMTTIQLLFGGMIGALKEARLPPQSNQDFTPEELVAQLRDLSNALGRPVTRKDVRKAGRAGTCARLATFRRVFGNAGNAFRQAGVQRIDRFSKADLLAQYADLSRELGKVPSTSDIQKAARAGKCAGYKTFIRHCGSLEELRKATGLPTGPRFRYTRQDLLNQLKKLGAKLGRTPRAQDLSEGCRRRECATIQTFQRHFGTINKALSAAGLVTRPTSYSRAQLILILQALAKRLGYRPTVKDVHKASARGECASAKTYDNQFGKMSAALRAANLDKMPPRNAPRKPRKPRKTYTREQMLDQVRRLGDSLGRPPRQQDVAVACARRQCPAVSTLAVEFGSFGNALRLAGFNVRVRIKCYTVDQLIQQLQRLTCELGRLPMTADIDGSPSCASTNTFVIRFGSLLQAREAAGLGELLTEMSAAQP
jgi:hypothetical protein